jgi:hypothetical protein
VELDFVTRGLIEKAIDDEIKEIKENLQFARESDLKKQFMLNNLEDFVFGEAWGGILRETSSIFIDSKGASYADYHGDILKIIKRRLPEIRKAIFDAG